MQRGRDTAEQATLQGALRRGTAVLRAAGMEEAPLEAELLLRHVLGLDKTFFYLRLGDSLSDEQQREFEALLAQRLAHRPTAYLTCHREFYGLDFHVEPGVLIPRPETELLVDEALAQLQQRLDAQRHVVFVDVGTGSGAIAIAVAKAKPGAEAFAPEISPAALAIAQYNARRLRLAGRVRFLPGDLLEPLRTPADVIAANLPYIPSADVDALAPELREHEPRLALDGGSDGLDLIRRLLHQAPAKAKPGGVLLLETAFDQARTVAALAEEIAGGPIRLLSDLAGYERVVVVPLAGR
jgi:release factor glutamine methyltransferase